MESQSRSFAPFGKLGTSLTEHSSILGTGYEFIMHDIEVDQSGRTDVLTDDTALAFSDGIQAAIPIPAAVKRQCYWHLKTTGLRKRLIGIRLFAAWLVLLLRPYIATLELLSPVKSYRLHFNKSLEKSYRPR